MWSSEPGTLQACGDKHGGDRRALKRPSIPSHAYWAKVLYDLRRIEMTMSGNF